MTYDYVIVGGGNAGLTLATRLAQGQSGTVAVVEAGNFYEISNGNLSQVPATDGAFTGRSLTDWQPLIDWGYATTPQAVSTFPSRRVEAPSLIHTMVGRLRRTNSLRSGQVSWGFLCPELHGISARQ